MSFADAAKKLMSDALVAMIRQMPDRWRLRLRNSVAMAAGTLSEDVAITPQPDAGNGPSQPVTMENWQELVRRSSGEVFVQPEPADFEACKAIQQAYGPVLERYGIPYEELFGGSIKDEDAAALHALVRTRKPELVVQVGTFVGYSALVIAHALQLSNTGQLLACDPELPHRTCINPVDMAREVAALLELSGRVTFVRGWFSLPIAEDFNETLIREIPVIGRRFLEDAGHRVDLAFIDGDHSLTATVCDAALIQEYLSVNGVAVFHDVKSWPSVALALRTIWEDIYFYRSGTPSYFSLDTWDGPDGLAAFRRLRRLVLPMIRIRVLDAETGLSIPAANVHYAGTALNLRCGTDGALYWWGEHVADQALEVTAPGYEKLLDTLGVATNGDFAERTFHLHKKGADGSQE